MLGELIVLIGAYGLWITWHLYLLITNDGLSSYFWPFKRYEPPVVRFGEQTPFPSATFWGFETNPYYYDLSEFVVYTLVPLFLIVMPIAYCMIDEYKNRGKEQESS